MAWLGCRSAFAGFMIIISMILRGSLDLVGLHSFTNIMVLDSFYKYVGFI